MLWWYTMRVSRTFSIDSEILEAVNRKASESGKNISETLNEMLQIVVKRRS